MWLNRTCCQVCWKKIPELGHKEEESELHYFIPFWLCTLLFFFSSYFLSSPSHFLTEECNQEFNLLIVFVCHVNVLLRFDINYKKVSIHFKQWVSICFDRLQNYSLLNNWILWRTSLNYGNFHFTRVMYNVVSGCLSYNQTSTKITKTTSCNDHTSFTCR